MIAFEGMIAFEAMFAFQFGWKKFVGKLRITPVDKTIKLKEILPF